MKTTGRAKVVHVFQPYGIGKRDIENCAVEMRDGRVEVLADKPVVSMGGATRFNFPADVCTIWWE